LTASEIHSNQGKQLLRHKFTSLSSALQEKKKGKSLGLRRCVTVCQHINRELLFSTLLIFLLCSERQTPASTRVVVVGGLFFFFCALEAAVSVGRGWRAKVKGCSMC